MIRQDDPGTWMSVHPFSDGPEAPLRTTARKSTQSREDVLHPIPSLPSGIASDAASASITAATTPVTSDSSAEETELRDLDKYIAVGCLHHEQPLHITTDSNDPSRQWIELLFSRLPDEVKLIIGHEASRLLEASWIRLFLHHNVDKLYTDTIIRVYVLPEDWGRRFVDRKSRSLKSALRELLSHIDISPEAWSGHHRLNPKIEYFDPWASAENVSLFYLFNKLSSPAPSARLVKNRYPRNAVLGLLEAASSSPDVDAESPIPGLKTKLYPYQARSAALMVQREAAPQLQLDPRLETRRSPTGESYYFAARDGSMLREPRYYETNRGGILAETMGLGKTIICLAVILATKGHMPQIPPAYQPPPRVRERVGSLGEMAASIIGRKAVPGKAYLEQLEAAEGIDLGKLKRLLSQNRPYYEIPAEVARFNRNTTVPPPRQLVMCGGTIIVVPRNLLHQWQSEIRKHVVKDGLKILVMDTKPKRVSKPKTAQQEDSMEVSSELPPPTELLNYDIVLFTRNRFEQEIQDGADEKGRRHTTGARPSCECAYIGATRLRDCNCLTDVYESPLKKLHWLRIIIDEGHNFSSGVSNAVLVAKQIKVERRWVVSGTPAKNLVGVELDVLTQEQEESDPALLRELAMEQRKTFSLEDDDNIKAAKALGSLASNYLMVRPWCDSVTEGKLGWEDYIYRHEHLHNKTYSGFSSCFLRTLEGLVVKTRPEDVERDIVLPPMRHRTVYLKPCWYDKMTANLFIQVLRANAITSERSDVDYLFHKNSVQARHSLIRNLRQSNFAWTGFSLDDVASTIETSSKYLNKEDKNCSIEDARQLLESTSIVAELLRSPSWAALSKAHEVGLAVEEWPKSSRELLALAEGRPPVFGITQLLEGQSHVDRQIRLEDPTEGLEAVGLAAEAKLLAIQEAESIGKKRKFSGDGATESTQAAVPSSCLGGQPLTSRRASTSKLISGKSPVKKSPKARRMPKTKHFIGSLDESPSVGRLSFGGAVAQSPKREDQPDHATTPTIEPVDISVVTSPVSSQSLPMPVRPMKRKLTLADETAQLPADSPLRKTRIVGTTSAKLTYLIQMVMKHQANEKILIFYDGDNAAYYIAQSLEMLYVNHRIYARTLDNTKRSQYVKLFNEDPDVRVLLIDVACGALGLNLNAASVVLIVNPINRPGIEAQAIKRAHRIGQTKEVLVETLVLEGTIEEAIFKRAKQMSRGEHLEAKTLEDDNEIMSIIQNAAVLPIEPGESEGAAQFALLETPQQVFGRPGREKYHRFGKTEAKLEEKEKPRKRVRANAEKRVKEVEFADVVLTAAPVAAAQSSIFG